MVLLAALTDFYTYRLAGRLLGNGYREAAVRIHGYDRRSSLIVNATYRPAVSVPQQSLPRARLDEDPHDLR